MNKNKALAVDKNGYKKYFLLDGKKMKVENFNLDKADIKKGTASEFKRAFGKVNGESIGFQSCFKQVYSGSCIMNTLNLLPGNKKINAK